MIIDFRQLFRKTIEQEFSFRLIDLLRERRFADIQVETLSMVVFRLAML